MKTHSILFASIFFCSMHLYSQEHKIKYAELENAGAKPLRMEPLEYKPGDNLHISLTITDIPASVNADYIRVVDSVKDATPEVVPATKNGSDPYSLMYDLVNVANDIDEGSKGLWVKFRAEEWGRFDLTPQNSNNPRTSTDPICSNQSSFQTAADNAAARMVKNLKLRKKDGLYLDRQGVAHLFIDQYGKQYGLGVPTTATPEHRFKLHLLTADCYSALFSFSFSYTGTYDDEFNIYDTFEGTRDAVAAQGSGGAARFQWIEFAEIGPFTDEFTLRVTRQERGHEGDVAILDVRVPVAKRYHVSIAAGMFATTLKNPQGIQAFTLPSGETTLIADDDNSARGVFTAMATFYPKGRSFLFPPRGSLFGPERFGFMVGAQLSDEFHENFFSGLSFDIARGCSLTGGVHFGRRTYVAGFKDFDFGNDVFAGELVTKKEWALGLTFGFIVDARVIGQLFTGLTGPAAP